MIATATPLLDVLREARALAEQLRVCALQALAAAGASETRRLAEILRRREVLISRLDPLLQRLQTEAGAGEADEVRRGLLDALLATQAVDVRLAREVERRRAGAAEALERLAGGPRSGGYGAMRPAARSRIDARG